MPNGDHQTRAWHWTRWRWTALQASANGRRRPTACAEVALASPVLHVASWYGNLIFPMYSCVSLAMLVCPVSASVLSCGTASGAAEELSRQDRMRCSARHEAVLSRRPLHIACTSSSTLTLGGDSQIFGGGSCWLARADGGAAGPGGGAYVGGSRQRGTATAGRRQTSLQTIAGALGGEQGAQQMVILLRRQRGLPAKIGCRHGCT